MNKMDLLWAFQTLQQNGIDLNRLLGNTVEKSSRERERGNPKGGIAQDVLGGDLSLVERAHIQTVVLHNLLQDSNRQDGRCEEGQITDSRMQQNTTGNITGLEDSDNTLKETQQEVFQISEEDQSAKPTAKEALNPISTN